MTAPYFPADLDRDPLRTGAGVHLDEVITSLGARQHATVSSRQLRALGHRRRCLERRVQTRHLVVVSRGIYVVGTRAPTAAGRRMVGIHAGGADAVLAELSAAVQLGSPVSDPRDVRIIVPPGTRIRRPGVAARDAVVAEHERQIVDDIPCLAWPRLLLDIAAHRPANVLANVWHDCVYRRLLDADGIERVLAEHHGEPGTVALRRLWVARQSAIGESRNKLEADLRDIVVAAGMPEPRRNAELAIDGVLLRPDLYIPERRLAIETDGKDAHADPEQQLADARRDELYRRLGLQPVRYAWWPVNYQTAGVQADFDRYEAWWQRTSGLWTPADPAPTFRLARRSRPLRAAA